MSLVKTITATMIRSLLVDDFDVGILISDSERRKELAAIKPEEVDELISRLNQVKDYIVTAQEERRTEALEALKGVLSGTGFDSVEELLAAAAGSTVETPKARTTSTTNNNKSFTVVIDRKQFTVINKQIPAALRDNEAYIKLIKARPEMEKVDNLLREYSTDYQQAYPLNAEWNGNEFHINSRGKLNEQAMKYFNEYKKKNGGGKDDKEVLKEFKEAVLK